MIKIIAPNIKRIKQLSADIASKIAAGEVVERPASVLKELLENSVDSCATKIDISIEYGGIQNITVTDNGLGIVYEDLTLALQQHATSKITQADDLASITSLGFRGEALASINSVSRLSITSQTQNQEHAWTICAKGLNPAAHPVGTTVKMQDLFYNVPARRKFLRSERTEYLYLEEVFRRIALSNFAIAFTLHNHGKIVKNLPACKDQLSRTRRLVTLCGQQILKNAITIEAEQNGMRLYGWLGSVTDARSQEQHQYFFINERVIKDRLINHAIRQVYQPLCAEGKMPFYCLYLELDPIALDVNVHPTKHEVRFRDARIIHAFLSQVLTEALGVKETVTPIYKPAEFYHQQLGTGADSKVEVKSQILSILDQQMIVTQQQDKIIFIDATAMRKELLKQDLAQKPTNTPLSTPHRVNLNLEEAFLIWCVAVGLQIDRFGPNNVIIRNAPTPINSLTVDWAMLLPKLHIAWEQKLTLAACYAIIADCIDYKIDLTHDLANDLIRNLSKVPAKGIWREYDAGALQALTVS